MDDAGQRVAVAHFLRELLVSKLSPVVPDPRAASRQTAVATEVLENVGHDYRARGKSRGVRHALYPAKVDDLEVGASQFRLARLLVCDVGSEGFHDPVCELFDGLVELFAGE